MTLTFTFKDEIRCHSRSLLTVFTRKALHFWHRPQKNEAPAVCNVHLAMLTLEAHSSLGVQLPRKPQRATDHAAVFSEKPHAANKNKVNT